MNTFLKLLNSFEQKKNIIVYNLHVLPLVGVIIDIITTILIYPLINVFYDNDFEFDLKKYDIFGISELLEFKDSPILLIIILITIFYFIKATILTFKVFYNEKNFSKPTKNYHTIFITIIYLKI